MPFLSVQDVVGREVQAVKNIKTDVVNSVTSGAKIVVGNATNQVLNTVNNVAQRGVNAALGAAVSAGTSLLTGDLAGAKAALNPTSIVGQALGGVLGSNSPGSAIEPGYSFTSSSSGGVTPGDALNGALARPDPMLTYLWYVQLPVVGAPAGGTGGGVNSASNSLNSLVSSILGTPQLKGGMGGAQTSNSNNQLPWYYVEEADCPFRNFQLNSVFRDGRKRHYPGQYTVSNLKLGFYMDVDNNSANYINAWMNTILQPYTAATLNTAGNFGRATGYKYPVYVYLIDSTKDTLITLEYTECFPVNPSNWTLTSKSGTDRLITTVDFSVGDVFVNMAQIPSSLTSLLVNNALTNTVTAGINSAFSAGANAVMSLL